MSTISIIIGLFILISFVGLFLSEQNRKRRVKHIYNEDISYSERLKSTKALVTFSDDDVMDKLTIELVQIGENATKSKKINLIKNAVLALNKLEKNNQILIETDEREQWCEYFNAVAKIAKIDLEEYDNDISSIWRKW